jgi:hypothetical protein
MWADFKAFLALSGFIVAMLAMLVAFNPEFYR